MTSLPEIVIDAAVNWWLARLRGEDDLGVVLDEYDFLKTMPVGNVAGNALGLIRSKPIPEEKILGFERDLRSWLRGVIANPGPVAPARLWTDYGPCRPMDEMATRHGINEFRFPMKTRMDLFVDRVVVNRRVIFEVAAKDGSQ